MKTTHRAQQRVAVFDIDGTIFRSSLIIELFNELVRRKIFPANAGAVVERDFQAWLNRKGHYNDYLMKLVGVFYEHVSGCRVHDVASAVRATISRLKHRVHRYPRQLIGELRRKGYFIMAISNSPEPMVKQFGKVLRFDAAIGHVLENKNGMYTGKSIVDGKVMPGHAFIDKVAILKRFIAQRGLPVDLKHSIMVGDSEGDLPLLSFVGRAIAFNPSLPLAKIAKRRKWQIIVERKDVVYDIRDTRLVPVLGQKARVVYGNAHRT